MEDMSSHDGGAFMRDMEDAPSLNWRGETESCDRSASFKSDRGGTSCLDSTNV